MSEFCIQEKNGTNCEGLIKEFPDWLNDYWQSILTEFDPSIDAWLKAISVPENLRGKKYGSNMLKIFEEECLKNGVRNIFGLFAPKEDHIYDGVRSFYEKHGYEIIDLGEASIICKNLLD